MHNVLINERDQRFTLHEMLGIDRMFPDFPRESIDQTLRAAQVLAAEKVYPALQKADRQGCKLENGKVLVPECFHNIKKLMDEGGWTSLVIAREHGGQGLPLSLCMAASEWFAHNSSLLVYTNRTMGSAYLIECFGNDDQKRRYLPKLVDGTWGGPITATEPDAGSDLDNIITTAVRQPDGTYRIRGNKIMISNGDANLYSNMVYTVLARIEGAPAGMGGLSIFVVPKYLVKDDGTPGRRNDYEIAGLEQKMGLNGWVVCDTIFGQNDDCYAELLGGENQGLAELLSIMDPSQIGIALMSCGVASAAYLHALKYARERLQGASLLDAFNPEAPRVPIIEHPDVRRMLIWMKAHVEGMRALTYYCSYLFDKKTMSREDSEQIRLQGLLEFITPICRVYCSETGFKVTEQAMQVYGSHGYFKDYPIEQFMRDIKPASLYEGPNGIQALQLVAMKMGPNGENFIQLLTEMGTSVARYQNTKPIMDLTEDLQARINLLGEAGMFFSSCAGKGDMLTPVANAASFVSLLGIVSMAWMLLWQAGLASEKLDDIINQASLDPSDTEKVLSLTDKNSDAGFYQGKIHTARYYIKHCLPQADGIAKAVMSADLSMLHIRNNTF